MTLVTLLNRMPGDVAIGIIWGIMALGVYLTFRILNFADLTVDGSFATGGAVAVVLITGGVPVPVAMAAAFAAGVLAGLCTGIFHTLLGIPDILSGILMQLALYSINVFILGGANKAIGVGKYNLCVSMLKVTPSIVVALLISGALIAVMYWYFGTAQGSAIRATGNNPAMSRAQGINIGLMKVIALALSNGMVALSGSMMAQLNGYTDVGMGRGAIVIGLAAVIIGEVLCHAIFRKNSGFLLRLIFVIVGGIIYYMVMGFISWLRVPTDGLKLFTALIVAAFLAVPYLKGKANSSFRKAGRRGANRE
ncbi:MAG: ABC transporter permease [Lachnospiraceae bacterium]|nr:ABC transporter permease [Lachnospiraceae bacterium]